MVWKTSHRFDVRNPRIEIEGVVPSAKVDLQRISTERSKRFHQFTKPDACGIEVERVNENGGPLQE